MNKTKLANAVHDFEVRELKERIADQRRQIDGLRGEQKLSDRRLGVALGLARHVKSAKSVYARSKGASESTAFLIGSDWHTEETVDPMTINGVNEFNLDIADRRIDRFFSKGIELINIQRTATDIDTCVLGLLGDHITGYIHEELLEGNSMSPTETVVWLQPRIMRGIDALRGQFKRVIVVCCQGNHGRTTIKKRVATSYKNSFEWLMYHTLASRYEGTNVECQISNGYHNLLEVYGRHIRFHHGDAIRYGGGIGGITIPVNKAIAQWNKLKTAYLDVFGHWHQEIDGGNFISNGSLIGYNAFALEIKASPETPQQTCFFIEKNRGKTIVCPVFVE
jgi:hypothetical protein